MIQFLTSKANEYNDWRWVWSGPWSSETLWVLAAFLVLALWWSWRSSQRLTSTSQKLVLLGLRLVGAAFLWLLLLGPSIELRNVQKIQNHLPIFFDTSASMRIQSTQKDRTRMDAAKDFWKRHKGLWEQLEKEQKVHKFSFSRSVLPLSGGVETLKADGDQTDLLQILRYVQDNFQDKPLAGMVLVTDGVDTLARSERTVGGLTQKGRQTNDAAQTNRRLRSLLVGLKRLQVPVHVIAPVSPSASALKDISVAEVFGDAFAFLHNTATVEALVKVRGFRSGVLPVSLYREGQLLKSTTITIEPQKQEYTVRFSFKPRSAGKFIYSVRTPLWPGEVLEENNRKDFILKIIRDRIRVLQVTGRPSWDVRFLRRLLKKNASVDLISFFILRTRQNIRHHNPPERDMALIQFPYSELFTKSLPSFDLVIFQDFNYAPYMSQFYLHNIASFVRKGGAFVMVGGELSFGAGGYMDTPIESILPFELGLGQIDEQLFRPTLTDAGQHHPLTRLLGSLQENKDLWGKLPEQPGVNKIGDARPGSITLLEHPNLKTPSGRPLPVLSLRQAGKGRVMALATDGSWKWNFERVGEGGTKEVYYRFWNNAIRWLIRDPELERVRVSTVRSAYRLGEEARFRIRVLDQQYRPLRKGKVSIQVLRGNELKPVHRTTRDLPTEGTLLYRWKPPKSGIYRLRVEAELEDQQKGVGEELFQVMGLLDEFQDIRPNDAFFQEIRRATGGQVVRFSEQISKLDLRAPTIVRVDRSKTVALWDRVWLLVLLFGIFAVEWGLRRRWGLP
ncbi:MAG: hypothetical protein H6728_03430 [Myxococcales bacterium]|nr:hypothetical protein [Myxococcales bacterium]MCB9642102.1 hypothetical protein [Myxococcales bacterium]